jgi:hypothetical protein
MDSRWPQDTEPEQILRTIRRLEGLASGISDGATLLGSSLGRADAAPGNPAAVAGTIAQDSAAMLAELKAMGKLFGAASGS